MFACQQAYASSYVSLGQAAENFMEPVSIFTSGLHVICYIIGGTLILGAGLQYRNYRNNPTAIRLSTPIVLLLLGIALILLPLLASLSPASMAALNESF